MVTMFPSHVYPQLRFGLGNVQQAAIAPVEETPEVVLEPWKEPGSVETLLDEYIVESKFSGRTGGTTLYLMHAKSRSGELAQVEEGQRFKLFLVAKPNGFILLLSGFPFKFPRSFVCTSVIICFFIFTLNLGGSLRGRP